MADSDRKRGRPSPFMESGQWETGATDYLKVRVPAGFMEMVQKVALEQGTTCSSLVRHSVLSRLLTPEEADRLEPMSGKNRWLEFEPTLPLITDTEVK